MTVQETACDQVTMMRNCQLPCECGKISVVIDSTMETVSHTSTYICCIGGQSPGCSSKYIVIGVTTSCKTENYATLNQHIYMQDSLENGLT